jgi:hypothetical protein
LSLISGECSPVGNDSDVWFASFASAIFSV